jgi:hypothetical protein
MINKDELQSWVLDHDEATRDIESHYNKRVEELSVNEIQDWLSDHDTLHDDFVAHFNVKESKENIMKDKLNEGMWGYKVPKELAFELRDAIDEDYLDCERLKSAICNIYYNIAENTDCIDEDDLDSYVEDVMFIDEEDEDWEDSIDYELSNLYDLCDNCNIWIPIRGLDENKNRKNKLKESFFEQTELFETFGEIENMMVDWDMWNSSSQEERDAMVAPAIAEFMREYGQDMSAIKWHEFLDDLEDNNYHTEGRIFDYIYGNGVENWESSLEEYLNTDY